MSVNERVTATLGLWAYSASRVDVLQTVRKCDLRANGLLALALEVLVPVVTGQIEIDAVAESQVSLRMLGRVLEQLEYNRVTFEEAVAAIQVHERELETYIKANCE